MSPEREKELEQLLGFLSFYIEVIKKPGLPAHAQDRRSLREEVDRIAREYGRSKALEGARQAMNDVVEDLQGLNAEGVELLDGALRDAGLQTFSEVQRRYSSQYRKVVRRGKIKGETEYYLINGMLVDQTSSLSDEEREVLQSMVSAYEG